MKPILTIEDFSQGISYDETESTTNGFSDLFQIDTKTLNGIAMLPKKFENSSFNIGAPLMNSMIEFTYRTDPSYDGITGAFGLNKATNPQILEYNTLAKSWTILKNLTNVPPVFSDMEMMQNRLFYPDGKGAINSIYFWTSGGASAIQSDGTTLVLTIADPFGNKVQTLSKALIGGVIEALIGGVLTIRNVTGVDIVAGTVTINSPITAGTYRGFGINSNITGGTTTDSGASTTMNCVNITTQYRPMINFNSKLYVGDGDLIYNLDSTLTVWTTTKADGAISVGTDWVIKQFEQIGGYIYILADKVNENYNNTFLDYNKYVPSRLYIWDGISNDFTNIIDVGVQCFTIKAIENRIYTVIQSSEQDGILFSYFNGSDFPTIAKLQVSNSSCPINCLAYDRGRFFIAVNSFDSTGGYIQSTIFEYGTYAIETPSVFKIYNNTASNSRIYGIDILKQSKTPVMCITNGGAGGTYHLYKGTSYVDSGYIETNRYEITVNQFGQLVKGAQLNFKETLPADCSVDIYYKLDEETSYTLLGTLLSANQNSVLYGINKRPRKIRFKVVLKTSSGANTPKLVKINLF